MVHQDGEIFSTDGAIFIHRSTEIIRCENSWKAGEKIFNALPKKKLCAVKSVF
jgi:hypothetical protein